MSEGPRIWPDDYSEGELAEEAVVEVVEGVLEGASFEYSVEYALGGFGDTDLNVRKDEIRERARERLAERGLDV